MKKCQGRLSHKQRKNTFSNIVKLSVLSLGHFISFSFAIKEVKGVNYFPSRANKFGNLERDVRGKRLVSSVKYHYYP